MLAIERRNAIARMIREEGSVSISDLTTVLGVSSETLRKDLLLLEKEGVLTRTHGGAVRTTRRDAMAPLKDRRNDSVQQKRELCGYALRYIRDGDVIAIDEGSTGAELAKRLVNAFSRLTVATNSLEIFNILSANPGFRLILCAGNYNRDELAFSGHLTVSMVRSLHFDKCFIFPSCVSLKFGIMDSLEEFIDVQQSWIERSQQVFVLAYSGRYERPAFIRIDDIRRDHVYITDSGLSDEVYRRFLENGIRIIKE